MSAVLQEMLAESGLAREEMTDVVEMLAPLDDLVQEVPAPSAELAALLGPDRGVHPRPRALFGGRRGAVAGVVVLALSGVGATGLSAAANTLPRPLQHRVSQFSHHYLPFDLPEPPARTPARGLPVVTPGAVPTPTERGAGSASRSIPDRDVDHAATGPATSSRSSSAATTYAQPYAQPSSSSGAAPKSAAASPMAQPYASGSPTTDRDPDQTAKGGKGQQGPDPDKRKGQETEKGADPGTDNANSPGPGGGKDKGKGPVPAPAPEPEPPSPSVPLPDPLPDLGPVGGTGSVDTGTGLGD